MPLSSPATATPFFPATNRWNASNFSCDLSASRYPVVAFYGNTIRPRSSLPPAVSSAAWVTMFTISSSDTTTSTQLSCSSAYRIAEL